MLPCPRIGWLWPPANAAVPPRELGSMLLKTCAFPKMRRLWRFLPRVCDSFMTILYTSNLWHFFYKIKTLDYLRNYDVSSKILWRLFYNILTFLLQNYDVSSTELWRFFYRIMTFLLQNYDVFFTTQWHFF
jgi:hypothetical protein